MDVRQGYVPAGSEGVLAKSFKAYFKNFGKLMFFSMLIFGIPSLIISAIQLIAIEGAGFNISNSIRDILENAIQNGGMSSFEDGFDFGYNFGFGSNAALESLGRYWSISMIVSFATSILLMPVLSGGVAAVVSSHVYGQKKGVGQLFGEVMHVYGRLVITAICNLVFSFGLALAGIIALLIPIVIAALAMSFMPALGIILIIAIFVMVFVLAFALAAAQYIIYAIVVNEGKYGFGAVTRAYGIVFSRMWRNVGVIIVVSLVASVASGIAGLFVITGYTLVSTLVTSAISFVTTPLIAVAASYIYYAVRTEKGEFGYNGGFQNPQGPLQFPNFNYGAQPTQYPQQPYQPPQTPQYPPEQNPHNPQNQYPPQDYQPPQQPPQDYEPKQQDDPWDRKPPEGE